MSLTGTWPNVIHQLTICLMWIIHVVRTDYGVLYKEPRLECLSDGIRLHIDPVGVFVGHVYVTGHFIGDKCHLNYCRQSIQQPFVMEVPYRGECNVRRHRSPDPLTVSYEVTVIIQHHPLFITAGDRAYRLNCIYKQMASTLTQKININELPPTALEGASSPYCRYDVLGTINGPHLQMANIGEPVVHKWTCNSDTHGFLVHSCVVRDQNGNEYNLVDERGCVAERALVPDIIYASDLSYAYTTINAFRFAEQIVVHFACQITLCQKRDQGCEGIAPPTCHPINFPPIQAIYKHTTSIPTRFTARDPDHYGISIEDRNGLYDIVSTRLQTTTPLSHNMLISPESMDKLRRYLTYHRLMVTCRKNYLEFRITGRHFFCDEASNFALSAPTPHADPLIAVQRSAQMRTAHCPFEPKELVRRLVQFGSDGKKKNYPAFKVRRLAMFEASSRKKRLPVIRNSRSWASNNRTCECKPKQVGVLPEGKIKEIFAAFTEKLVYTTSSRPILPPSSSPNTIEEADISGSSAEFGIEISKLDEEPRQAKQMRGYRTETLSSISNLPVGNEVDPLPLPSPAGIFYAYNRRPRSSHENANNVTLDVESKRMLVFSSDDSERLDSGTLRRQSQVSSTVECNRLVLGQTVFVCVAAILQVSSVVVILVQRLLYRRNLHALLLRSESSRY